MKGKYSILKFSYPFLLAHTHNQLTSFFGRYQRNNLSTLINGGELDGVRILAPLNVDLMHRDQTPKVLAESNLDQQGTAFGLDFEVILDPVKAESYSKGGY